MVTNFPFIIYVVLSNLSRRDQRLNKKVRHAFHLVIYESKRMSELTRAKQKSGKSMKKTMKIKCNLHAPSRERLEHEN